jgi:hypothetical protein
VDLAELGRALEAARRLAAEAPPAEPAPKTPKRAERRAPAAKARP